MDAPTPRSEFSDLLHRLRRGDPAARGELIVRCQAHLQFRVRQMLPHFPVVQRHERPSDVAQDVVLRLDDALKKVAPRDTRHLLSLAGLQVRRTLLDLARKWRDRPVGYVAGRGPGDSGPAADPGCTTYSPERLARWAEIHEYIEGLPADERELFDLLFYQDVPQEDAAVLLQTSYRTLKRRWQAARLRFMGRFGPAPV
jgi:RNA polymerase sigma factor (sigma-70 family)